MPFTIKLVKGGWGEVMWAGRCNVCSYRFTITVKQYSQNWSSNVRISTIRWEAQSRSRRYLLVSATCSFFFWYKIMSTLRFCLNVTNAFVVIKRNDLERSTPLNFSLLWPEWGRVFIDFHGSSNPQSKLMVVQYQWMPMRQSVNGT